jgi:integrase/recombinase XerD
MNASQILDLLTPQSRQIAEGLIAQLARQEGIEPGGDTAYPEPLASVPLWEASLRTEGYSPRTLELYVADARRYLALDPRPTQLSVQTYLAGRMEEGLSAARISSIQKGLKSLFKFLREQGLWGVDPVARMKLIKGRRTEVQLPSPEAIALLLSARLYRKADEPKFKTMLVLLLYTGLRIEEACSLERLNIHLKEREIKVLGKGNKERTVPISPEVAALLQQYIEVTPTTGSYLFPGPGRRGYWDKSCFERTLKRACRKQAIVPPVHPHQLRHFFATTALRQGLSLKMTSRILGHSSVAITGDIYQHVDNAEVKEQYDAKFNPLEGMPRMLPPGGGEESHEHTK